MKFSEKFSLTLKYVGLTILLQNFVKPAEPRYILPLQTV